MYDMSYPGVRWLKNTRKLGNVGRGICEPERTVDRIRLKVQKRKEVSMSLHMCSKCRVYSTTLFGCQLEKLKVPAMFRRARCVISQLAGYKVRDARLEAPPSITTVYSSCQGVREDFMVLLES